MTTNQDEDRVLILLPESRTPSIEGSTLIEADCGHRTWISPTGRAALPIRTACTGCIPGGSKEVRTLPGAREELIANGATADEYDLALKIAKMIIEGDTYDR